MKLDTHEQIRYNKFKKTLVPIRFVLKCLRPESVLHQFMNKGEQVAVVTNTQLFAKSDERLYLRDMGQEEIQRYACRMEADLARVIWLAVNRGGIDRRTIAQDCELYTEWVDKQLEWWDTYVRVCRASMENKAVRNEIMALAWAIANN